MQVHKSQSCLAGKSRVDAVDENVRVNERLTLTEVKGLAGKALS
jgi:hypothetical protein